MSTPNKSAKQKQKDLATMPTAASKPVPSNGRLAEQLKNLLSVSQQLLQNHAKGLHDIDNLKSENITLQEQVIEQNQRDCKPEKCESSPLQYIFRTGQETGYGKEVQ
jgi:hypothetical protein